MLHLWHRICFYSKKKICFTWSEFDFFFILIPELDNFLPLITVYIAESIVTTSAYSYTFRNDYLLLISQYLHNLKGVYSLTGLFFYQRMGSLSTTDRITLPGFSSAWLLMISFSFPFFTWICWRKVHQPILFSTCERSCLNQSFNTY